MLARAFATLLCGLIAFAYFMMFYSLAMGFIVGFNTVADNTSVTIGMFIASILGTVAAAAAWVVSATEWECL